MKLSDYVADFIAKQGVGHVFLVSGGAIIHIVDSAASHPQLTCVCSQHEQGAGAAADGYARTNENLGVALTTSGPGATNLTTSVCNAYFDSIPVLFITGQVATFRLRPSDTLRQKGFQETDVISIFKSITKYAVQIKKAEDIKFELTKAVYFAKEGRPGPVVVDIPDDLQRVQINPDELSEFKPPVTSVPDIARKIEELVTLIKNSRRPVLIMGAGIRIAKAQNLAIAFAEHFHIPAILTWGGMDLLPRDHEFNMGGLGVCGPRAGNFAVQNSDLVIALGTRLSQMITGGKQDLFAPKARKVMVDIDSAELNKFTPRDFQLDLSVQADLKDFFNSCAAIDLKNSKDLFLEWRRQIREWDKKYPICPPQYYDCKDRVNPYVFVKELSKALGENDIIIADTGANVSWTLQAFEIKKGQRIFSAWNHSPMGYSLPGSIGAALAAGGRNVICLTGDGGLMMSLEELATVRRYNIPIKIFIFNNHGHGIQKQTIDTWLNSRYVAVNEETGLSFPDFEKTGKAFKLTSMTLNNHDDVKTKLKMILKAKGPVLCNVEVTEDQRIVPMLKFGAGLEDLDPKLPFKEIEAVMRVSQKDLNRKKPSSTKKPKMFVLAK